ncbi:MAG TPA: SemiSWEET transporter, partial [Candidatus Caenarcaniphilales bacterium]
PLGSRPASQKRSFPPTPLATSCLRQEPITPCIRATRSRSLLLLGNPSTITGSHQNWNRIVIAQLISGEVTENFVTVLGLIAGTLTTIAFIPQLTKTWYSKSAQDVSLGMLITFSTGVFLWLTYGLLIHALPVILANLVTFVLTLVILVLKIKYD